MELVAGVASWQLEPIRWSGNPCPICGISGPLPANCGGGEGALREELVEPLEGSGSSMGSLASPKMAGRVGRGWTMERARRLADGRPRPPKVYSSYSFQG